MKYKSLWSRYYDFRTEVTFHGRVFAPTLQIGVEHVRALLKRRVGQAHIKGDKDVTIDGFDSTGIIVSASSAETQKAERAVLRQLAQKYPRTALTAAVQAIERLAKVEAEEETTDEASTG